MKASRDYTLELERGNFSSNLALLLDQKMNMFNVNIIELEYKH